MTVELITGFAGTPHIGSDDIGAFQSGIVGDGDYALATGSKLTATMSNANTIAIQSGDAVLNGRHVRLTGTTTATIQSGTQGQKRNDKVVLRYSKDTTTGVETCSLVVIKGVSAAGTATDPVHNTGSILDGIAIHDMPLYRIPLDGIAIGTPVPLFNLLQPMADVWASMTPVQYDSGHGVAWRYPGRQIAFGIVSITWEPNSAGNDAPSIRLPFKAASADWVHVQLQLCNNEGWQVDGFNQIGVIPSDISPEGFRIRSWNASDMNLTYRVAWRAVGVGTWGD